LIGLGRIGVDMALQPVAEPVEVALIDRMLLPRFDLDVRCEGKDMQLALACRGQPRLEFGRLPRLLLGELHQHRCVDAVDLKRGRAAPPIGNIGVGRTEAPNLLEILTKEIAACTCVEPIIG
jgi:hypothetical protein